MPQLSPSPPKRFAPFLIYLLLFHGLWIAWPYLYDTQSLWSAMIAHSLNDFLAGFLFRL